jgi:hypothetical protein
MQDQTQEVTMDELLLEVAQQRVAEAWTQVADQAGCVADLARQGLDTTRAKAVLAIFEQTLRFMREDLAREQERAAGNQP